ncbi:hypothetical protein ACET3Z_026503 [Daucus carota]
MADKSDKSQLQKHDKAISALEAKMDQTQATLEQLTKTMGDHHSQARTEFESLGAQVSQLSTATGLLNSTVSEMMKWLQRDQPQNSEGAGSAIQGKGPQNPNSTFAQNTTHTDGEGSVHQRMPLFNVEAARNLCFGSRESVPLSNPISQTISKPFSEPVHTYPQGNWDHPMGLSMEGVDNFARLSSLIEAYTRENALLNATEPTTHPLSINEMSQVAPKTYNFCQVCGVQGHYGYECSYNVFNSQNAQSRRVNDYQEGYEYNQYSSPCDQQWMDQPDFSYMDNDFQNFSYHDQPQVQQQCYNKPPLQQYELYEQQYYQPQYEQSQFQQYPYSQLQQELQVPLTNVDVPSYQTNEN